MTTEQKIPEIGKSIRAFGVLTNYHEAGSGKAVILIHGSGPGVSAWSNWRLAIPYLAERLHAFAYDQLGFGYTELPAQHVYGLECWTEHLFRFMDAVGVERAHLIETIPFRGQTERLLKEALSFCSARDYSQWCLTLG